MARVGAVPVREGREGPQQLHRRLRVVLAAAPHPRPADRSRRGEASLLGVTRRGDGTSQVTYAGHPLYRFEQDTEPGQTNGQGLDVYGAEWYVLSPAGTKVDR